MRLEVYLDWGSNTIVDYTTTEVVQVCNEAESTWENMTCSSQLPTFDLTLLFNTREPVNKPVLYRPVWLSLPLAKLQSDNTCCIIYQDMTSAFQNYRGASLCLLSQGSSCTNIKTWKVFVWGSQRDKLTTTHCLHFLSVQVENGNLISFTNMLT